MALTVIKIPSSVIFFTRIFQDAEVKMSLHQELRQHRDINFDAHKRLEEAYETIRELTSTVGFVMGIIFNQNKYNLLSKHRFRNNISRDIQKRKNKIL